MAKKLKKQQQSTDKAFVISDVSNSVCPLCHGTGYYSYGGSFGGAVQTERCHCRAK